MSGAAPKSLNDLASSLVDTAKRAGERRGLYGAEAGELLRQLVPDFDPQNFGTSSVREFIEKHVPDLQIIGRSGSDVVYGLRDWPALPLQGRARQQGEDETALAWRVWVSPSSQFSVAVAIDGSRVRSIRRGDKREDEVEIEPAQSEVHRKIAQEFLLAERETLGSISSDLEKIIKDPSPSWWTKWTQAIRAVSPDLNRRWFEYRRNALERVLAERLKQFGFDDDAANRALSSISVAREVWHRDRTPHGFPVATTSQPLPPRLDAVSLIRDLTSTMAQRDLRNMSLLLGLMLDAIIEKPRR
jgi:hypothetical protein